MNWVHDFAKGTFQIYAGNTLDAFQPLDFFHFYPLWYDLWLNEIDRMLARFNAYNKPYHQLAELLPVPSSIRAILQKIVPSYRALPEKNPVQVRRVTQFFVRMLREACPTDPFGHNATPLHPSHEVAALRSIIPWRDANPGIARQLGRLIAVAGSLAHGLYNDLVTDFGWDTYGPYEKGNTTMLIRHFPDLAPRALWDERFLSAVRDIKIYSWYEGVKWRISCVGCHTVLVSGNQIEGLQKYAVIGDGQLLSENDITRLIQELSAKAESIYREIRTKNFEELKIMVLLQECYQTRKLGDVAGVEWRPTTRMYARVRNQPLLRGLLPHGKMMTDLEEYKEMFGINQFAREVLT